MTTVTLGLDGACFDLIDDWIEDGTLPALRSLREEGIASDMRSCLPPVTCPNWKCYATGTNPGKLGVFWWEWVDRENGRIVNTSSNDQFDGPEFWQYVDGPVGILNLPTSYPPPSVDRFHVAGGPGADQTGYTNPASLQSELEETYDYQVHPEKMALLSKDAHDGECVEEIHELIGQRFDVLQDYLETGEFEFLHLTVFYINVLHHFFWDHDVVKEAWRLIDDRIADLVDAEELSNLVVISDHGSNEIHTEFRINTWLQQEGYLQLEGGRSTLLRRVGITRERVRPLLAKLGIEWWARRLVPERIQNLLPSDDGRIDKSGKTDVVDWESSLAVASGQGPVYALAESPERRREIAAELREKLDGLTEPDGRTVVDEVHAGSEIYDGPHVERGPDLVVSQGPGVHVDGSIGADDPFGEPSRWRGENKSEGLFLAAGDDIAAKGPLDEMHITDVAPTILHLIGYPVPERMDGTVRRSLFRDGSDPAERPVDRRRIDLGTTDRGQSADGDQVQQRLQDLGYLN